MEQVPEPTVSFSLIVVDAAEALKFYAEIESRAKEIFSGTLDPEQAGILTRLSRKGILIIEYLRYSIDLSSPLLSILKSDANMI